MASPGDKIIEEISRLYTALDDVRAQRCASKKSCEDDGSPPPRTGDAHPRIILASRKLPFELKKAAGATQWRGTSPSDQEMDQIIANLQAVFGNGRRAKWVGWPRCFVPTQDQTVLTEQLGKRSYFPVWLEETKQYQFYNGFCKTVLWPLFHSLPPTTEDTISISRSEHIWNTGPKDSASGGGVFDESTMWQAYVHVNQRFADRIRDVYEDGDLVWIQDYHLMLVPQMLRALLPHAKIGFFLHVAFPSSELYRILPYREEILRGILAADLVGFQTYQYARYFFQTCESILGLDWSPVAVEDNGHYANVCIIPIGIAPATYSLHCRSRPVDNLVKRYERQFAGKKVILGVDSLDVTKGLVHKLLAIEEFLTTDCGTVNQVVFVQVALSGAGAASADSSMEAESSASLESHIGRMASRINSTHCSLGSEGPLHLIAHVTPDELLALYGVADALLITPIRDGMNVVPFQYVVARNARRRLAAVVLSEFTGCARSLGGAVLVNPWDTQEMANKIRYVIYDIEPEERRRNHDAMIQYVERFTSSRWSQRFLHQLGEANEDESRSPCRELHREQIINAYQGCGSGLRVLILGLEGVIAAASTLPELLVLAPGEDAALSALCANPQNAVIIVSTRSPETLDGLLGHLNCILVAESGWFIKWSRKASWECQVPYLDTSWRDDVERVMEYYTERTPGSFIELKAHSIAWHFRDCDLGHGAWQAKQLQVSLTNLSRRLPFRVNSGNKMIEVGQQSPAPPEILDILLDRLSPATPHPTNTVNSTASVIPILAEPSGEDVGKLVENPQPDTISEPPPPPAEHISAPLASGFQSSASVNSLATSTAWTPPNTDVEFVLVILRGDDPTDEDIFEVLAPDPVDLDDFINEMKALEKADLVSLPSNRDSYQAAPTPTPPNGVSPTPPLGLTTGPDSSLSPKALRMTHFLEKMEVSGEPELFAATPTPPPESSEDSVVIDDAQMSQPKSTVKGLVTSPIRIAEDEEPAAVPLASLPSRPRRSGQGFARARTESALGASAAAPPLFAIDEAASVASTSTGVASHSAVDRRNQIYMAKRFTPRTDFPPSALLFKAMKRKYGPHYSRYELPDTAAACWALVRSMEKEGSDGAEEKAGKASIVPSHGHSLSAPILDERVYETMGSRRIDGGIEAAGTSKHFQQRSRMSMYDPLERRLASSGSLSKLSQATTGSFHGSMDLKDGERAPAAAITPPRRRRTIATSPTQSMSKFDDADFVDGRGLDAPVPVRTRVPFAPTPTGEELPLERPSSALSTSESFAPLYAGRNVSQGSILDDLGGRESVLSTDTAASDGPYPRLSEVNLRSLGEGPRGGGLPSALAPHPDTDYVFPINTFSVVVGLKITQAHYFLKSKRAVSQLLSALSEPINNGMLPTPSKGMLSRTSSVAAVPPTAAMNEAHIFVEAQGGGVVPLREVAEVGEEN